MSDRVLEIAVLIPGVADMKSKVLYHTEIRLTKLPVLKFVRTPV